jgi:hypothetical protein
VTTRPNLRFDRADADVGEPQIYADGVAAKNSGSSNGTSGLSTHFAPTPLIGSVHQMH